MKPSAVASLLVALLSVLAGCTSRTGSDVQSKVEAAMHQVQVCKQDLELRDQEIARLAQDLANEKRRSSGWLAVTATEPSIATGQGDGRFVVVPSSVRPGDTIAIYNDLPNGDVNVYSRASDTRLSRLAGPKSRNFVFYTFPSDVASGEYLVTISGPGGWWGEAKVIVEPNK